MNTNAKLSTTNEWLVASTKLLTQNNIATARLDSLVLLEDALGRDKSHLLAHPEKQLTALQIRNLNEQIVRRKNHDPLAYIRGKSEFYGREFIVNRHTLEPRPETENMIKLFKKLIANHQLPVAYQATRDLKLETGDNNLLIVDVGTGSGCIGITVKLEHPENEVVGMDVSNECLDVARKNTKKLGADVAFYQGDLLLALPPATSSQPCILLCNLPYVPDAHTINKAAMQEPKLAIFGGSDGLDLYRKLFEQIGKLMINAQLIFTESLPNQHKELTKIAQKHGFRLKTTDDFIQLFVAKSKFQS